MADVSSTLVRQRSPRLLSALLSNRQYERKHGPLTPQSRYEYGPFIAEHSLVTR